MALVCPQVSDNGGEDVTHTDPSPHTDWHHHAEAQRPEAPRPWGETLEPRGPDVHRVDLCVHGSGGHRLQGRCAGLKVVGEGPGVGSGASRRARQRPAWGLAAHGSSSFCLAVIPFLII